MEMIWPIQTTMKPVIPAGRLGCGGDELSNYFPKVSNVLILLLLALMTLLQKPSKHKGHEGARR
ncbi:MAG: hypothetical protein Q8O57_09160, partial [Kiritimatiellota bacterium]|nr:hypothetical protein [Kiritimatiellota bacterium]